MKTHAKLLCVLVITALFVIEITAVASGQDAQAPQKRRLPLPPADNSDIILPSFSLNLEAGKTTAAVGEKLDVDVTITNTSSGNIFYSEGRRPFGLEVRDESGREVPMTSEGVKAQGVGGSASAVAIHPGQSIHRSVQLDREFELDKPGNYFVQAERGVSRTNRRTSNPITITIVQKM